MSCVLYYVFDYLRKLSLLNIKRAKVGFFLKDSRYLNKAGLNYVGPLIGGFDTTRQSTVG